MNLYALKFFNYLGQIFKLVHMIFNKTDYLSAFY